MYLFNRTILLVAGSCMLATAAIAQTLPDSLTAKINKIFDRWNKPATPGCAVGIVSGDSLIFARGYGMADLEYSIPNSPETIFHMASVSKQFTAYAIILLARQGKLKLDDDIHQYLNWFPKSIRKITIRNLLNHTSGIRDQWQLVAIQGTRLDDVITQEHLVKVIGNQKDLNFVPGTQYSYSNSNYTLLAEIVRSVSGQSLRKFTDSAIFKPLGMASTHFHDDYTEIVMNRAHSYSQQDSAHYANAVLSYSNAGATSLFTNVKDMSHWIRNFYHHQVGDEKDIDSLTERARLSSGKELGYAAGIVSDKYKGWTNFLHGGGDAGFRTFITAFPDLKMGFIVFGNLNDFNPSGLVYQMADLFVKDTSSAKGPAKEEAKRDSADAVLKADSVKLKNYLGDYISDEGLTLKLEIMNHKLYYRMRGQVQLLMKDSVDRYAMFFDPNIRFVLNSGSDAMKVIINTPDEHYELKKYVALTPNDKVLQTYSGEYYSPELGCTYTIRIKEHELMLGNNKYDDAKLTLTGPDHLLSDNWWISNMMITRNKEKQISGFEINTGRVMHLKFIKVRPWSSRY